MVTWQDGVAKVYRYRVSWETDGVPCARDVPDEAAARALADSLTAQTREKRQPDGEEPAPGEQLAVVCGGQETVAAKAWTAIPRGESTAALRYNAWTRLSCTLPGEETGAEPYLSRRGGRGALYIRALRLTQADDPAVWVQYGVFSDETGTRYAALHLRPGQPEVAEDVPWEGVTAVRLPGGDGESTAYAEGAALSGAAWTAELEYWLDAPGTANPPEESAEAVNRNIAVTPLDTAAEDWIDGRAFGSFDEICAALEAGEAAYQPPQALEDQITAVQLALVELYEGGLA